LEDNVSRNTTHAERIRARYTHNREGALYSFMIHTPTRSARLHMIKLFTLSNSGTIRREKENNEIEQ